MIATLLAENPLAVRVGFWLVVAGVLMLGWFLDRRRARRTLLALSGVSLLGALVLTLSPDGEPRGGDFCTVQFSVPFQGLDTLANVALLLPLAAFLALAVRRPLMVLVGTSVLSVLIELTQALLPTLGRSCDTNDWLMNTVGALVGAGGAGVILLATARRERRRKPRSARQL